MAGSSQYTAVLDANTLYPAPLRDLLLSLAVDGLYHARWTARIHEEWVRNLTGNRPEIEPRLGALGELMNRSVPDCLVENYEGLIAGLVLPDPDDRHVLAAAIAGHADAIVTFNLKDFPAEALDLHLIEAIHPGDFVLNQLELRPYEALAAVKNMGDKPGGRTVPAESQKAQEGTEGREASERPRHHGLATGGVPYRMMQP